MVPLLSMRVRDVMTVDPATVDPEITLSELRERFEELRYSCFPVVSDDRLVGIVGEYDLLEACLLRPSSIIPHFDEILTMPVRDVMSADCVTVAPDDPLSHVIEKLVQHRHKSLPVLEGGKLVGIIARSDLLGGLHERVRDAAST